jgi:ABC-type transport system involved in cytochrome bd biosynthesis fused ATPase/permease subunit
MKILRAIGFGIFLLILLVLMPAAFAELSKTVVVFLQSSQQAFVAAGTLASHADDIVAER